MRAAVSVLYLFLWVSTTDAWFLPGSMPTEYMSGDSVLLKVDKMVSSKTQVPYSFYYLPYCAPDKIQFQPENLGEILTGGVIQNTKFDVHMFEHAECKLLCSKKLTQQEVEKFITAIDDEYMVNMLADNLPGALTMGVGTSADSHDGAGVTAGGIPVGVASNSLQHTLVNHWDFVIFYHTPGPHSASRVVGFEVSPRSIKHMKLGDGTFDCAKRDTLVLEGLGDDELAFTYSVSFVESPEKWISRWSLYLNASQGSVDIHWFSIINAVVVVLLLSGLIAIILLRTLLKDIARYNQLDDLEESQEEFGWKLVHGDVFRRPFFSKLLAASAGTGVQLLGMASVTLVFATLGVLNPASRGSLLQAALCLFVLMGWPAGYVSARFNKLFEGDDITRNFTVTCMTAFQFPGVCFGIFFVLNLVLWSLGSSGAVPFGTMFLLLGMWFGISMPLVFIGSRFGYRKTSISIPVRVNQIPRQIPPVYWLLHPLVSHLLTGILPFCAVYTELLFILGSVWLHRFYYLFGFLSIVVVILVITCAEISIAVTYFNLTSEQYTWWWKAYYASASSALYVFLYSMFFFTKLSITKPGSVILYFAYTFLMSYVFFLFTGAVGFISAFWFVRAIYGAVRVD